MISINFTYSDTLNEYIKILVSLLSPHIYDGVMSIYSTGKRSIDEKNHLASFQQLLKATKSWSNETKEFEYNRIKESSSCPYIDKLIRAVLISNTKVLVGDSKKNAKSILDSIDVNPCNFVYKCYLEVARKLYTQPSLVVGSKDALEKQKDFNILNEIIKTSIQNAVRNSLPIEKLVDNFLVDDTHENNERAINEMTEQFQDYLTKYMEEVNKRVSLDIKQMVDENRNENKFKTVNLSPINSPNLLDSKVNEVEINSENNSNFSIDDSPISTISLKEIKDNDNLNLEIVENNQVINSDEDLGKSNNNLIELDFSDDKNNIDDLENLSNENLERDVILPEPDELACSEVEIVNDLDDNEFGNIEVLDNVNLENDNNNNNEQVDSDERRKIEIVGLKGSNKRFLTRRERDNMRKGNGNNFSFFDDA